MLPVKTSQQGMSRDFPLHLQYFCCLHNSLATVHEMEHKNKAPAREKKWLGINSDIGKMIFKHKQKNFCNELSI